MVSTICGRLLFLLVICFCGVASGRSFKDRYVLVKIRPDSCTSSDGRNWGVCLSSERCSGINGTGIGTCADGYGTCCSMTIDPCLSQNRNVTLNGTHLVGPSPSLRNGSPLSCSVLFPKQKDVCGVRLDFLKFEIAQPQTDNGNGVWGDCTDTAYFVNSVTATSPTPIMGQQNPFCGNLTGQHVYLTNYDDPLTAGLNFYLLQATNQSWDIQVTFLKCDSPLLAPKNCLQYFTTPTGTVTSFNYPYQQYNNQDYSVCIKSQFGLSTITWNTCGGATDFYVSGQPIIFPPPDFPDLPPLTNPLKGWIDCPNDWVQVYGDDRYCGNTLFSPPLPMSTAQPFMLNVHFNNRELDDGDLDNTGFCLIYTLSP